MLLASWNFYTVWKGFRSLNAKNLGSVGQRAAKLLAVKVRVLKKKSAALALPAESKIVLLIWYSLEKIISNMPELLFEFFENS